MCFNPGNFSGKTALLRNVAASGGSIANLRNSNLGNRKRQKIFPELQLAGVLKQARN